MKPVAAPPAPAPKDTTPRTVAFAGTAVLALVVAAVAAIAATPNGRRPPVSPLRSIPRAPAGSRWCCWPWCPR